jgi:hypothetical protein
MGVPKPRRLLLLIAPLLLSAAVLCGLGKQDEGQGQGQPKAVGTRVRVSGRVRLVGSGPGTELVITGPEREWHIDRQDRDKLRHLQQQIVTVEGTEHAEEMTFANGVSAGTWYVLRDIRIIEPPEP